MSISTKEKNLESNIVGGYSNFLSPPDILYQSESIQKKIKKISVPESRPIVYESNLSGMDMSCYAGSGF